MPKDEKRGFTVYFKAIADGVKTKTSKTVELFLAANFMAGPPKLELPDRHW